MPHTTVCLHGHNDRGVQMWWSCSGVAVLHRSVYLVFHLAHSTGEAWDHADPIFQNFADFTTACAAWSFNVQCSAHFVTEQNQEEDIQRFHDSEQHTKYDNQSCPALCTIRSLGYCLLGHTLGITVPAVVVTLCIVANWVTEPVIKHPFLATRRTCVCRGYSRYRLGFHPDEGIEASGKS